MDNEQPVVVNASVAWSSPGINPWATVLFLIQLHWWCNGHSCFWRQPDGIIMPMIFYCFTQYDTIKIMLFCKQTSTSLSGFMSNHLCFNASKCKSMLISRKQQKTDSPILTLSNCPLERVECFKYLGLLLSSDLSWSSHIESITSMQGEESSGIAIIIGDFTNFLIQKHSCSYTHP